MDFSEKLLKTKVIVILKQSKVKLSIPLNWIYDDSNDVSWIVNWGVKKGRDRTIFFWNDLTQQADFSLPIRDEFDGETPGCYIGRIVKSCGKLLNVVQFAENCKQT